MGFSVAGWNESQNTAGALTGVAALADQHITPEGDDIVVPEWARNLAAVLAWGATISQARIESPSLRRTLLLDVAPLNIGDEPLVPTPWVNRFMRPIELDPAEGLRLFVAETVCGAENDGAFVWLQGEKAPLPEGRIDTVRRTGTATLVAEAWSAATMTLSQQVEAGDFDIVGYRHQSAGARAARLIIPGSQFRPGAIAYDADGDAEDHVFRHGGLLQSWGKVNNRFMPQAEVLATSGDTAETDWLDIIRAGA